MKKVLSIIISVIVVISALFSVNVSFAKDNTEENILINPVYKNYLNDETTQELISVKQSDTADDGYIRNNTVKAIAFNDIDSAAEYVRDCMIARQAFISLSVKAKTSTEEAVLNNVFDTATSERLYTTTSSGDYLKWSWGGCGYNTSTSSSSNGYTIYTFNIYMLYYTNAQQEKEVDAEIADAINKLDLESMTSTYDKISAIYNYICKVADYDMVVESPDDNPLSFTAYGCLIENKTVCQGYATAIYKICKTIGIPVRVINNDVHGWNIVKIGDEYYNLDATWDDNNSKPYDYSKAKDGVMWGDYIFHSYFLKSDADMQSDNIYHYKDESFLTGEFEREYPISNRSYYDYKKAPITSGEYYHTAYCPVCGEVEISLERCQFDNNVCIYCLRDVDKTKVTGLHTVSTGDKGTRISIAWDAVEGATEYKIYQNINYKFQYIGSTSSTSYDVKNLHPSWEYYFKVSAVVDGVESDLSDELHTMAECAPPSGFTAEAVSNNEILVNWNSDTCHGYYIEWSTDPTFKTNTQNVYITGNSNTSKRITVNGNAGDYYVRMRLWKTWGDGRLFGDFSDSIKVVKVSGLRTESRGDKGTRISIAWNAVEGATEYKIYQNIDYKFQYIGSTTSTNYDVTNLHPNWEYYFKVSAVVDGEEVGLSEELHTMAECAPPSGFSVEAVSDNEISVNWNSDTCHGYYIEWSTDSTFETNTQSVYITGNSNTSKTITVNGNAGDYYVRMRLWKTWGDGRVFGDFSESIKIVKVSGLHTESRGDKGTRISIAWNAVDGATEYRIYQNIDYKFQYIGTTSSTKYDVTNLHPNWEYYFKVSAVVDGEEVGLSEELHTMAECAPPSGFTAKAVSDNEILVNWNSDTCHGYYIEWSTDPTFAENTQSVYITGNSNTSKTITVNGNAGDYYVRMRLWKTWGDGRVFGDFSESIKIVKVSGLRTESRGDKGTRISIAWDAVDGATEYRIYQNIDYKFQYIGSTTSTNYDVTNLHPNWEYYFKVSAVVDGKEVGLSEELHTMAECAPPSGFLVEAVSDNEISVNWNSDTCHGYYIEWSTDPNFSKDTQSVYITGNSNTSKTITVNGNAGDYYVRMRLWKTWGDGRLFGDFSESIIVK